ncbi:hypothetical protein BCR33DRAFT_720863 [Rhizoclosmatium globosum]|uniref:Uncharacterized protein n=1 Tax=Rhizoclosmatium globosum TaxID=329046 RepID=A0A1Y2BTY5_9FUNG|nr:hypothetical protein BCR33DRAFT_720863 [Rhizoclosmatium globosum]|eukprot:ORY38154.1 hypothetical protein BCR33DRAFT_720863 [Rhizoclosmatium globosum]
MEESETADSNANAISPDFVLVMFKLQYLMIAISSAIFLALLGTTSFWGCRKHNRLKFWPPSPFIPPKKRRTERQDWNFNPLNSCQLDHPKNVYQMPPKKNRSQQTGLSAETQALISDFVIFGGIKANKPFEPFRNYLAQVFQTDRVVIDDFIKDTLKKNPTCGLQENGGVGPAVPADQVLKTVPSLNIGANESRSAVRGMDLNIGTSETVGNLTVPQLLQVLQAAQSNPLDSLQIPQPTVTKTKLIDRPIIEREAPKTSTYQVYLSTYAGPKVKALNEEGFKTNANYVPLKMDDWEALNHAKYGTKTFFKHVEKRETTEDAALYAVWEAKARELNTAGKPAVISEKTLQKEKSDLLNLIRKCHAKLESNYGVDGLYFTFDDNTSVVKDCSTGKFGRRVSEMLYSSNVRPPLLFLQAKHEFTKRAITKSEVLSATANPGLRNKRRLVAATLFKQYKEACKTCGLPEPRKLHLKRLLSPTGFKGLVMKNYPFPDTNNYKQLTLEVELASGPFILF